MSENGQDLIVRLPMKGGGECHILREQFDGWRASFPDLDVYKCLLAMQAWLWANPDRRKTPRGISRFVVAWLLRESSRQKPVPEVDPYARLPRYGAK
jgi:hypothetical protein